MKEDTSSQVIPNSSSSEAVDRPTSCDNTIRFSLESLKKAISWGSPSVSMSSSSSSSSDMNIPTSKSGSDSASHSASESESDSSQLEGAPSSWVGDSCREKRASVMQEFQPCRTLGVRGQPMGDDMDAAWQRLKRRRGLAGN